MSVLLHHSFLILVPADTVEKMQTDRILQKTSNQFQGKLTASWVSGCFVWSLHVYCGLLLLSRSHFLLNTCNFHTACLSPPTCVFSHHQFPLNTSFGYVSVTSSGYEGQLWSSGYLSSVALRLTLCGVTEQNDISKSLKSKWCACQRINTLPHTKNY